MKRIFSFLIALLLVASTAGASDFSNFNFNFDWSPSGNSVAAFYSPFTTTLSVLTPPRAYPGTTGTFTRASAQYVYDHENVLRKVESGSIAIPGSRIVTNLLTYSEDLSNAAWGLIGTATKSGNTFLLPAVNDRGYQTYSANVSSGETLSFRISLSGTGTTHIRIAGGVESTSLPITLASTAVTYRVALTLTANVTGVSVYVRRDSGDTATSVTVHNAQLEEQPAATSYIPTAGATATRAATSLSYPIIGNFGIPASIKFDWKPAILAAIAEVQALNEAIPALQADPIPVNPDAEQIENMMGDVMSPPNEFGYSTVRIDGWRKLIMPRGVAPTTFSLVFGQPVEDVQSGTDENGNPIYVQVYGGTIAE